MSDWTVWTRCCWCRSFDSCKSEGLRGSYIILLSERGLNFTEDVGDSGSVGTIKLTWVD